MRNIFFSTLVLSLSFTVGAQTHFGNTFFVELGGISGYYSLNYDCRIFQPDRFLNAALIIGHSRGYIDNPPKWKKWHNSHLESSLLLGKKRFFGELGLGITRHVNPESSMNPKKFGYNALFPILGGRYQNRKGLFLRIVCTPYFDVGLDTPRQFSYLLLVPRGLWEEGIRFYPWFGLGLGYTFEIDSHH